VSGSERRQGLFFGIAAYVIWGMFPLYWPLLKRAGAVEILAHRIVWSLAVVALILTVLCRWRAFASLARSPRQVALVCLAGLTVAINWGVYIFSVNTGHTIDASLGYFIMPMVSVLFGVLVFGERPRSVQWMALGIAAVGVLVMAVEYAGIPWIALVLAISFGAYGLLKKLADTGAVESLTVETLALCVPALAYLFIIEDAGTGLFPHGTPLENILLVGGGVVTVVPLLLLSGAATRIPLATIGMIQYITPVLQFSIGLLVQGETMATGRWVGFALVWSALSVLVADGVRAARRPRASKPLTPTSPP
jgi:chloramphenicol-sensitive protein RarD